MNNKFKQMQLHALDKHLANVHFIEPPSKGWIASIRQSLGMSARQMAERMGITQQSVAKLEKNEAHDAITLKSLRKAAESLECRLVYAFIPNEGSLEANVKKHAYKKAKDIVDSVELTMMLEGQSVGNVEERTERMAKEMVQNLNSKFWDK